MSITNEFGAVDPVELVDYLLKVKSILPATQKQRIRDAFSPQTPDPLSSSASNKADFSLHKEVMEQVRAVKVLRESAVSASGALLLPPREAKAALSAATSLLTILTRLQTDIYNANRVRVLQKTTIDVLKDVDPELQEKFVELMRKRLSDMAME